MGRFRSKAGAKKGAGDCCAVQTGHPAGQPFCSWQSYGAVTADAALYRNLRENIPILDAAIGKLVRLTGGFSLDTGSDGLNAQLNRELSGINVGGNQQGIEAFIATYLDQLLTYGSAVGEMITDGRELYALYNGDTRNLEVRRAGNGLDLCFFSGGEPLPRPELLLYSVLNPEPGAVAGTSLLRGLPFVSRILLQIYNTIGQNWSHAGNLRYAVVYRPGNDAADRAYAGQRAQTMARSWQEAMDASSVKDFVAVGDVDIRVIGADNQFIATEVPVRQLLEQIVAKLGLPPFLLGLSWSSTERMSSQQSDLLTGELEAYRRLLTPVLAKTAGLYLRTEGFSPAVMVEWSPISLQDEAEEAEARLTRAKAEELERKLAQEAGREVKE